jgi:GT2 family glycosyltransferase
LEAVRQKVSIIIPHYNLVDYLKRLLESVSIQTYQDYEVIIIDDFTPDRSAPAQIRELIKDYPKMRLVENTENMRFARTCNRGIELAKGNYVCLLNQDTVVKNNFIQRHVEIMDTDTSIGALGCIVVDKAGNNWFTGGRFKCGSMTNLVDQFEGIRTVDFVAGTAPFYRREVFDKIGLFDESLGMYHEDVEFSLRMKAKTSYKSCMFSDKLVVHYWKEGMPQRDVYYYSNRNHIMLLRRYGKRYIPIVLLCSWRQVANLLFVSVARLNPTYLIIALYAIKGTLDGLIGAVKGIV